MTLRWLLVLWLCSLVAWAQEPPPPDMIRQAATQPVLLNQLATAVGSGNWRAASRILAAQTRLQGAATLAPEQARLLDVYLGTLRALLSPATIPDQLALLQTMGDDPAARYLQAAFHVIQAGLSLDAGQPQKVSLELDLSEELLTSDDGPLRFLAATYRARLDLQQHPERFDLVARHQAAFRHLSGRPLGSTDPIFRSLFAALSFWNRRLLEFRVAHPQDTAAQACQEVQAEWLQQEASNLALVTGDHGLEVVLARCFLELESAEWLQEQGLWAFARNALLPLERSEAQLVEQYTAQEAEAVKAVKAATSPLTVALKPLGVPFAAADYQFSLQEGELARFQVRLQTAWVRQLLHDQAAPREVEARLERVRAAWPRLLASQGRGPEVDPDLLQVEMLVQYQSGDWRLTARPLAEAAVTAARALAWRPHLIAALQTRARLREATKDRPGALADLQEAVREAEGWGGPFPELYIRLARLYADTGRPREALEFLARGQGEESPPRLPASPRLEEDTVLQRLAALPPVTRPARPVSLTALQKAMPAELGVLVYLPCPDRLYEFVLSARELKVRQILMGSAWLAEQGARYRQLVAEFDPEAEKVAQQLYGVLLEPFEAELAPYTVVGFVPGDDLATLPLAALGRPPLLTRKASVTFRHLVDVGASESLLCLWPVSEGLTRDVTAAISREMSAGKSRAEALRLVLLKLVDQPLYYWAPFILMGGGR